MTEERLQKVESFLTFYLYFTGPERPAVWREFTTLPDNPGGAGTVINYTLAGVDNFNWRVIGA